MGKFVYRGDKRSAEDIARKSKEGSKDYDSIYKAGLPTFKPADGDNTIRILPSGDPDDPDWDLTVYTHYNVGADEGRYLCLSKMKDEDCPICDAAAKADDDDERDQLRVVKGCAVWLIDRNDEKAGPKLWSMPFTKVRNEIHSRSRDKKTGAPILVDDPEEGFDISFTRSGTGTKTAYTGVEVDRDPSPLSENAKTQTRWLEFVADHPLKDILNFYEAEHIEKVLMGQAPSKRDAEDDDEEDTKKSAKSRRASKDDDDEEEDTKKSARRSSKDDDDDEEDAKPSRGKRRGDDDEEEEAEQDTRAAKRRRLLDDDDDEGEKKPSRRSAKEDDDDEIPFDKKKAKAKDDDEEEDEDDTPVSSARRQLSRLKDRKK